MNTSEARDGRDLFRQEDGDFIEELAAPVDDGERPIDAIDISIEPGGRKQHPWFMDTRVHAGAIFTVLILVVWGAHAIITAGRKPKIVVAGEAQQISDLKRKLSQYEGQDQNKTRENASLTQGVQFEAIPMEKDQDPNKDSATLSNHRPAPTAQATPSKPPVTAGKPVTARHTVSVPRTRYTPPRPVRIQSSPKSTLAAVAKKPLKAEAIPTIDNCVEFKQGGVNVPACNRYKITIDKQPQNKPITIGQAPQPAANNKPIKLTPFNRSNKPTLTAFAPKRPPVKPDYQVNLVAGEIQTVEQYQEEMYGSGQGANSGPQSPAKMMAKVVEHIEWTSPQEAQQIVIPLEITSGTLKGQDAEAKITSINGVQFTAQLTSLNGQPVDPGAYEVRRKNTKYLRAQHKTQGGTSFGNRLLGTVAAIGGEMASDQLADVRGGSHVSRLIPQGSQRGSQVTQYWKFDGAVEIVKK